MTWWMWCILGLLAFLIFTNYNNASTNRGCYYGEHTTFIDCSLNDCNARCDKVTTTTEFGGEQSICHHTGYSCNFGPI